MRFRACACQKLEYDMAVPIRRYIMKHIDQKKEDPLPKQSKQNAWFYDEEEEPKSNSALLSRDGLAAFLQTRLA